MSRPQAAPRARGRPESGKQAEPSVLIVGAGEATLPGLELALQRHRVFVEIGDNQSVVDAVVAAAPDLILLVGDAAHDCGADVLRRLTSSPLSSVVPVAILDDNTALDVRLRAFRHGAAAIIPRSASVDAIADQVARLAREIPERGSESLGVVGEATLHEFVNALSKELRSGILTVSAGEGHEQDAVRLVLGSGRPLAHFIDDFVTRVRRHVVLAEPLRYEFDERAGGTVQLLSGDTTDTERVTTDIHDLRVALADDDTARADSVAQELRQHGASVVVTDLNPVDVRFLRLRQVDPSVLLIGESHVQGPGYELVRRMRRDTRLRWASLLVVRWDEVWSENAPVPAVVRLKGTLAALAEPERAIRDRAETGAPFDTRLEIIGPARCLRALAAVSHPVRASIHNPRVRVEVDLSDGLVVGAAGQTLEDPPQLLEGAAALSAVLVLSSGRVHVQRVEQPKAANIMATIDVALDMADAEKPPISPSLPVPHGMTSSRPPPSSATTPIGRGVAQGIRGFLVRSIQRGPEGTRISTGTAVLLVVVATLLSSLLVAVLYIIKQNGQPESRPAASKPRAESKSSEVRPPTPGRAPPEASAASASEVTHAPDGSLSSRSAQVAANAEGPPNPEPQASDTAAPELPGSMAIREPNKHAPTCASLLSGEPPRRGASPGASYHEIRQAHRELIRGDLDGAQRAFCRAAQWDKRNTDAMTGLARLLLLRRDGRSAAEWARRADKLRPGHAPIKALLGDAFAQMGDHKSARAAWLASTRTRPTDADGVRALVLRELIVAERSLDEQDNARAERFFRRAALLDPKNAQAAAGLARALMLIGDVGPAVGWAQRASELSPENSKIRILLGDALAQSGDKQLAEKAWREALALEPSNGLAQNRIRRLERSQ